MVVALWTIDATRAGMEEGTMTSLPPAGWYPNPSGAPGQRYFDGRDWTAHHRASPRQPMAASLQPIPASSQPAPLPHPSTHADQRRGHRP